MKHIIRRAATIAALCLGTSAAHAQATNAGDIRGTVTDTSGALIPDVTVTVLNVETGVSKDFTTNHDGVYDTASIVAGRYQVTFTKPGFGKYTRGPITVDVGLTTVNAPLKIGDTSEEVTVTNDVPLLHTEDGQVSATLEAKDMAQLPNVGGSTGPDWQNFMILLPGASGTYSSGSNQASQSNPGQEVSTNGNLPFNNVLQDGASTTLPSSQNANPATFEDVQELQVSLSSFSAQYGVGGLIINQITKGGTDQFHGVAYEYFQNDALNAYQYVVGGVPNGPYNSQTNPKGTRKPFLRFDDFGGTFSGPVAIPFTGLRKKAFFFFGYDQIINNGSNSYFQTVPTAANQAGQFTGYTIYDPTTQKIALDPQGNPYPVRQSFQQEYGTNAIPANLIDKVSANYQKYFASQTNHSAYQTFENGATANGQGISASNLYVSVPVPRPWKRYFGRLDYDISSNNRLTLSDTQGDNGQNGFSATSICPVGCQIGDVDNNNAQITDVWNISPHLVNEARMGYTDQLNFFQDAGLNQGIVGTLGWQYAKADTVPGVGIGGYNAFGPGTNAEYKEFVFDPSDVVTLIKGKNIFHFGGEFAFYRDDDTNWGNINAGSFNFSGQYTQNWTLGPKLDANKNPVIGANGQPVIIASPNQASGSGYADFLLGYSQSWGAQVLPEFGVRLKKPQMFVQDDIKLKPNFTLNLGLRYEISHGFNEVKGNEATFDPTVLNPANNTPGAYWYGETKANGRSSLQADVYTTFLPRAGFSWAVHPNSTVRGGFGLYSYNFSRDNYGSGLGASLASSGSIGDQSNGIYPVTKFDGTGTTFPLGGGTSGTLPYTTASTSPTRFNGQGAGYNPYNTPIAKTYQWNLGIEQQIGNNVAATLSYVGSHGYNLTFPTDINAVPQGKLSSNDTAGCGSGAATCQREFTLFQGLGGNVYNAISNYHSLQATLTKRFTSGFSASFNYVWSHFLDDQDSSGWGSHTGPQNFQYATTLQQDLTYKNYGPSNFDVRNAFKGYAVYDLPFGRGRQFLNKNLLLDEVLGGFQASGTLVIQSGSPFQVFSDNNTYQQAGEQFPNVTGISSIPVGGRTHANWYNPAAFSDPGAGGFGNAQRNPLVGPGYYIVNLSALKSFDLPFERVKFSVRADASNAFNHATFGPPTGNLRQTAGTTGSVFNSTDAGSTGQITSVQDNGRNLQLGARLSF